MAEPSSPRGPQECPFLGAAGSHGLICLRRRDFHFPQAEYKTKQYWGSPDGSVAKNLPASAGDLDSHSGAGRVSGEGNGYPLQYSFLGNPVDRGAWWATVHGAAKE